MLCHAISDIWVANMKVMYEFTGKLAQGLCFFMMLGTYAYTRLYVFPFVVIRQYYEREAEANDPRLHLISKFLISYLLVLVVLHIFWTFLMVKGLIVRLVSNDERSAKKNL